MLVPAPGVYAGKTRLEGSVTMKQGMMNIGKRPTFDGEKITLETNIFDFSDDIYDKLMLVSFEHRIRSERKFESPEQLKEQLTIDRQIVKEQFKKESDERVKE
jgi:riboflavin kinase/FMN adenylyltransferase